MSQEDRKLVFDAVDAAWNDFVFYARKLDKRLSPNRLKELVRTGVITKSEIAAYWQELVRKWLVDE